MPVADEFIEEVKYDHELYASIKQQKGKKETQRTSHLYSAETKKTTNCRMTLQIQYSFNSYKIYEKK